MEYQWLSADPTPSDGDSDAEGNQENIHSVLSELMSQNALAHCPSSEGNFYSVPSPVRKKVVLILGDHRAMTLP